MLTLNQPDVAIKTLLLFSLTHLYINQQDSSKLEHKIQGKS